MPAISAPGLPERVIDEKKKSSHGQFSSSMAAASAGGGMCGAIRRRNADIARLVDSMYWPWVSSTALAPDGATSARSG